MSEKISIMFFLHPDRKSNLQRIHNEYKKYKVVDEVIVVTGSDVNVSGYDSKFKFVQMPGPYDYGKWPYCGLLGRFTYAMSCKNKYVLIQDDDLYHTETSIKKMLEAKQPMIGTHPRWFKNGEYLKINKSDRPGVTTAPIVLTPGVLIDTDLLPDVIKLARIFWKSYQEVFNGDDIFLARAISNITGKDEFMFVDDDSVRLPTHNVQLDQQVNKKGSRSDISSKIYKFFEDLKLER